MLLKLQLIFAILVALPLCLIANLVRLPKFSYEEKHGIFDGGLWSPRFSSSIRGLKSGKPYNLIIEIEHLPDNSNFQMDLGIQCRPSGKEFNVQFTLPFELSDETVFCRSVFPFTVTKTRESHWMTKDNQPMYRLWLTLSRVSGPDAGFQETLSQRVRLRFSFHSSKWRLESNSIFLLDWNSAFKLNSYRKTGRSEPQYFLTDQSMDLMLKLTMPGTEPFEEIQFFEPNLINLMTSASEFVRSYINIEAIMLFEKVADCHTSRAENTILFGTRNAGVIELHNKMLKVAQIDRQTGKMMFSRYGLSAAMKTFYDNHSQKWNARESYLRICAGIELSHSMKPVSSFKTVERIENPQLSYKISGIQTNDCQIFGPSSRRVTFFGRSGRNWLICPILCTNLSEPYVFYKGSFPLAPESTRYRTEYFNEAISALKEGTVIELRDDVTHEDQGVYSCKAGTKEAIFNVSVVSMPQFTISMHNGETLIGHLPKRIYAVEGNGYSVSCTVYFTGIESVTLVPEFYMKRYSTEGTLNLTKVFLDAFTSGTKPAGLHYRTNISSRSTKYNQTMTLTVEDIKVNISQNEYLFNHRFVCDATAAAADSHRYGMTEYRVQSGTDVLFVPRLRENSFSSNLSGCCLRTSCAGKCIIEISLKPELRNYFTSIGVTFDAVFTQHGAPYSSADAKFDPHLVKIVYSLPGSLSLMPEAWMSDFLALKTVIRCRFNREASSFKILRGPTFDIAGDTECSNDINCLYSTGFEPQITNLLTPAGAMGKWAASEKQSKLMTSDASRDAARTWIALVFAGLMVSQLLF